MSNLTVLAVHTKRQRRAFLTLPWQLYQNDPYWIPPLRRNQAELVGLKPHPFYDDADGQCFLAVRDGNPCGRILAIVNRAYNRRYQEKRGFFGFFESIDDPQVASGLFDAAFKWLAERQIYQLRGPCNPSLNYECGLLIDGFDSSPTFRMTYNPSYYARLLEACGFVKAQDLYAFLGRVEMLKALDKTVELVVKEVRRHFQVQLRPFDPKNFADEVRMFLDIFNRSLVNTWGFAPLAPKEADHIAATMRYLLVPEMTSIAEVDGRVVGAALGLLDYNPRIKQIDGRLFPFGFFRLLWNRRAIKRVLFLSTNILPEYQRWGLGLLLLSRLAPEVLAWGIEEAEFSWVLESNQLSRVSLQRGGAKLVKTYRIYDSREV